MNNKLQRTNRAQRTQQFLRYISIRLSGRVDCKRVQFLIGIGVPIENFHKRVNVQVKCQNKIFFSPDIWVYKDLHHRKDVDLRKVTDHILMKYYPELLMKSDSEGMMVDVSKFVPGVYEYQLSVDGKRRRWVNRLEVTVI